MNLSETNDQNDRHFLESTKRSEFVTANGELRVLKLHLNALCQIMITLLKDRKDTTTVHFRGLWAGQALFRKMHYIISFSFISTSR